MAAPSLSCLSCGAALARDSRACGHCGTAAARRRCGTCFDLNLADDQACRRCGSRLPSPREEPTGGPVGCPGCGAAMSHRSLDGLPFAECDACGGLWLTPAVLENVKTRAAERAQQRTVDTLPAAPPPGAAAARVVYRRCPSCRAMMNRSHLAPGSGFVADVCKEHGVFFDAGELARLFSFVETGGLVKARRREEEALRARVSAARREAFRPEATEPVPAEPPSLLGELAWIVGRWLGSR
jgi:Zn-finger nucleic acid-binding protein